MSTATIDVSVVVDGVRYMATASAPQDAPWGVASTVTIYRGDESLGGAILFPSRIMGGGDGWSVGDQDSDELTDDILDALGVAFTDLLSEHGGQHRSAGVGREAT